MANTTVVAGSEQQLVRVFSGVIGGLPAQVCDGRELHVFLQNGKQFSDWIKQRISQYGFEENQDFECLSLKSETQRKDGQRGVAKSTDYHLTLDMAKELSMVENNEQGRMARRYFIGMERQALASPAVASASALPEPRVKTIQHAFQGRQIAFAVLDGKPWVCAANICTALSLGSSDRITRSLPAQQKRRIQRGATGLWMIDTAAALRAADYCRNDPERGERYRQWLSGVLAEIAATVPTTAAPVGDLSERDLACLYAVCEAADRVSAAHEKLAPVFDAMRSNALMGVSAALEALQVGGRYLRHRFGQGMQAAATASGLADPYMSPNLLGIKLGNVLAATVPLQGELLAASDQFTAVERFGLTQLLGCRLMCSFDGDGKFSVRSVEPSAAVLPAERVAGWIGDREGLPRKYLPDVLAAVAARMKTVH